MSICLNSFKVWLKHRGNMSPFFLHKLVQGKKGFDPLRFWGNVFLDGHEVLEREREFLCVIGIKNLEFIVTCVQLGLAKTSKMLTSTSSKNLGFFWGLASKNLNLFSINIPQCFILNFKNSVLIPTSKFEVFESCNKWGFSSFTHKISKNLAYFATFFTK